MKLPRFLIGLALLGLAQVAFKFATDPFASSNIWRIIGFALGFVISGALLGMLFWVPIRWVRGAEKAPDRRVFALYTVAVFVAVFIVIGFFVGTPLSKSNRLAFTSGFEETCFPTQRPDEEYSTFNDSQLREYCSCVASSLTGKVTEEELKYLAAHKALPGSLPEKYQQASEQCRQELVHKWQGGNP